ncbi:MAG: pyrimidine dimer DNA glycosylase/endonuclease V [Candidatus Campbellbacteria bacterium]|nr:pyrimidine dimer DNA glycosylase/endonuclease V [Candidatus Campbellbacteria bacterium]
MRIWDIDTKHLCRKHLLGEHRELHGLWNVLTKHGGKGGYSKHPETKRWVGKTRALYERHDALVKEMERRGYNHWSPLDEKLAKGKSEQSVYINTLDEQRALLRDKPCECFMELD